MKTRLLITLLSFSGQWRMIINLAAIGLVVALNIFTTLFSAIYLGAFLALALPLILMWFNVIIMWGSLARYTKKARAVIKSGLYPESEFTQVCGLFVCLTLSVIPGLFSLIISWFIYIAPIRIILGRLIFKAFKTEFDSVYEELQTADH